MNMYILSVMYLYIYIYINYLYIEYIFQMIHLNQYLHICVLSLPASGYAEWLKELNCLDIGPVIGVNLGGGGGGGGGGVQSKQLTNQQ